jgi:hypothetical protein
MNRIAAMALVAAMALAACASAAAPTPQIIYVTPAPNACTVTWLYSPPGWMTKLVSALANGEDVPTGTPIDTYSMTPCEKAQWLAGSGAGGDCQGTVCLGITDTAHGRYDRGLEGDPMATAPTPVPAAAAPLQCAIQRHGAPWDGPELIVTGPEGSCRSLQVSLSPLGVWDTVVPVWWSNGDPAVTVAGGVVTKFQGGVPVFLCGGMWNGLRIDVYYSSNPNVFHGDYGTAVCTALSLPGR